MGQRQLEAAVDELRKEVDERGRALQARDDALEAAEAARATAEAKCAGALADVRQLEIALDGFAKRQQQAAEERNSAECARLNSSLEEREASIRALEAEREVLYRRLEAAVAAAAAERDRVAGALREHSEHLEALANGLTVTEGGAVAANGLPAHTGSEE